MQKVMIVIFIFTLFFRTHLFAETLSLQPFLDLVKAHSKDLKLVAQEREMANATKKEAFSTALPSISAQANYNRNFLDYYMYADLGELIPEMGGGVTKFKVNRKNEYDASVTLTQTLFSFSVGNAIKASRQYARLTDYSYTASELSILNGAKKIFYQVLLFKKVWEVQESSEQNAYENFLLTQDKFKNGLVSEFQLLQAEVRWKNAIPRTAEAKRNHQLALNNLKNWAGIPVEKDVNISGSLDDYPELPERIPFDSILQKRPDYNALLWEEKLLQTNVNAEKAEFYPSLTGTLTYLFNSRSDQWKLDEKNENYIAGVSLSIPIFQGGFQIAQLQKAKIELNKARINIEKSRENIYNEITNIYLRLNEAHQRISSARATLKTAEKAFAIAETTMKNGLATQLELKDARIGYDEARLTIFLAIFDYLSAYFDWEQAVGGI